MPNWAAILIIATASFITGRFIIALFIERSGKFDGDTLALVFSSLIAGFAVLGWFALVLAEFGWYSLGLLGLIWLLITTGLTASYLWVRRTSSRTQPEVVKSERTPPAPILEFLPAWSEYVFLAIWLVAATWLFFRPHQFIVGGADAGVYTNLAASISESGSIVTEDTTLADLDPSLYPAMLRSLPEKDRGTEIAPYYQFPGFYVTDAAEGRVMPQFYPLHPIWQAVAYGLGSVESALLMTGLWALLGGLAIYLVIRELVGWEVAALGLLGLSLTALQVWFARYPTTESLTQFLLWAAIWCSLLWLKGKKPRALWAALAGVAFGLLQLVRIDTFFLLGFAVFAWFYLRWNGRWRREDWWFFVPFGLLSIHSLVHALTQSTPYFYNTFSYGIELLQRNWLIPVLALVVGAAILALFGRYRHAFESLKRYHRPVIIAGILAVILLFIYGWFLRPALGDLGASRDYWFAGGQIPTQLDRENLVRLVWYLSPLGIVLAAAGICLMLWRINIQTAVVLGIGLFFSLLYLWKIQANPHQIYAMRRYVPAVFPFFIIAAVYFIDWLLRQKRKWMVYSGLVLTLLWLAGLAWSARGFISQVDYDGLIVQMDELDSKLDSGSILIFVDGNPISLGDVVGTPLHYIYGHSVFTLRDQDATDIAALSGAISAWAADNRSVYWIGDSTMLVDLGLTPENSYDYLLSSPQLENAYENKPTRILNVVWKLNIAQLN